MIKSTPNVWYNIDELYTITSNGKTELNVNMPDGKRSVMNNDELTLSSLDVNEYSNNNNNKNKSRFSTKRKSCIHIFADKCNENRQDRIKWIFIMIIILICCVLLVWSILANLINGFKHPHHEINYMLVNQIPFPAVTICSENKINKQSSDVDSDNLSWYKEWELMKALCDLEIYGNPPYNVERDNSIINKALLKFSPPSVKNFVKTCKYGDLHCFDYFTSVITDDGLCFTFNGINSSLLYNSEWSNTGIDETESGSDKKVSNYVEGWSPDSGYLFSYNYTVLYPKYAASHKHELILELMAKEDLEEMSADDSCRGSNGFKVMIHDPATVPHISTSKVISVPSDTATNIIVTPTLTTIARDMSLQYPDKYPCQLWNNHKLDYFKWYTKENCVLECFTKFTLHLCNCVGFYMPRKNDTEVCDSGKKWCLDSAYETFFFNNEVFNNCSCLPTCDQILYDISSSSKYYSWSKYHKIHTYKSMSKVIIRYDDFQLSWHKNTLEYSVVLPFLTIVQLIVLGIFILVVTFFGISVINIVELFIFFPSNFIKNCLKNKNRKENVTNINNDRYNAYYSNEI
ncbi:pickpocket protein 28-like [Lycorma delicatula]|uniref:pickpocket protein 28-like n=1 Tax=Lycorma delicatula TaxID=130591 RepID=UPI003F51885B